MPFMSEATEPENAMNLWLLRFHRWVTLAFALPLAVVVATGLVLSFEPIVQTLSIRPGSLTLGTVETLLARHDPQGRARSLSFRSYENRLTIGGVLPDGETIDVDIATGALLPESGPLSGLFYSSRVMHEALLGDLEWLVTASTIAMLALGLLGIAMGWPRLRNSLAGWHKGVAWFALPLVVLSPLTGLALVFGITLQNPSAAPPREPSQPVLEVVRFVAAAHDLSRLHYIRQRGGRQVVRLDEAGAYRTFVVTRAGLVASPPNWPRLIHEGNWAGVWSGAINVVTSLAIIALMGTGLTLWARRHLRRWRPRRKLAPAP